MLFWGLLQISVSRLRAVELIEKLLANSEVKLAGLAARDSLRLEAGLCLYGNDIDETTTPVEATLVWTIGEVTDFFFTYVYFWNCPSSVLSSLFVVSSSGKRRRKDKDFPGAEIVVPQIKAKTVRKRVGLVSTGPPVRQHTPILSPDGKVIGENENGWAEKDVVKNILIIVIHYLLLPYLLILIIVKKQTMFCVPINLKGRHMKFCNAT